ncbi:MAG: TRAP transporter small permease [Thermodesulfobacteriota bacterium]
MKPAATKLTAFRRALHAVIKVITWIAAGTLSLGTAAIVVNVLGRYVFSRPLPGTVEFVELTLVVTVFFSVAYTEVRQAHVTMDEVVARFPRRARAIVISIMYLASGLFMIVMAWQDTVLAIAYATPLMRATDVLKIPIAPFIIVIAFGALLLGLELLLNAMSPLSPEDHQSDEVK